MAGRLKLYHRSFGEAFKQLSLASVKNVKVTFDPFNLNIKSAREFLYALSSKKIRETNLHCGLKTDVICDRTDPLVQIQFTDGHKLFMKSANLNTVELIENFNTQCRDHEVQQAAPSEEKKKTKKKKK